MRYSPTPSEMLCLDRMKPDERLHYFISRTMESEELWRLCDADGWVIREESGTVLMPVWPYEGLAQACAGKGEAADAVSLEYFIYHELNSLHADGIGVEIFPAEQAGVRMSAAKLFRIFEAKIDQEQYFIEG